jgi:hypothetical protein
MMTECIQDSLDFGTVEGCRVVGAFDWQNSSAFQPAFDCRFVCCGVR